MNHAVLPAGVRQYRLGRRDGQWRSVYAPRRSRAGPRAFA